MKENYEMSGINKALFDTNILIDYLLGHKEASKEFEQYETLQISIITKMEVLFGTSTDNEEVVKEFLENFEVISVNEEIAELAVNIRKGYKIKLPDAIIWATAKHNNRA